MRGDPREYNKFKESRCVACGHDGSFHTLTIDHIKTRGSWGKDVEDNCMTLCSNCHIIKGSSGPQYMATKFPSYKKWLVEHNWEFCEFTKKWKNYNV